MAIPVVKLVAAAPGEDAALSRAHDCLMIGPSLFTLQRHAGFWRLLDDEGLTLTIDFNGPDYHRRALSGKQELIAKAIGASKGARRILDLSAGLGQDAVFLCQLGFEVTAVERNPVLAFLLREAWAASRRPELQKLSIVQGEAAQVLSRPEAGADFDCALFDPMYPHKKKKALARQEMRVFRKLVGDDSDAPDVFAQFLLSGPPRLAVKRPPQRPRS